MKIRTDFVTNSSSSSYIAFTIRNKALYDALTRLGISFSNANDGEFNDEMVVTLPSGKSASQYFDYEYRSTKHALVSDYDSILEWMRSMWFDDPSTGGLVVKADGEKTDRDEYDEDSNGEVEDAYYDENIDIKETKAFLSEFGALLEGASLSTFNSFEGDTEYALIDQKYGEDGEPGPYIHYEVQNGRKLKWFDDGYSEEEPDLHGLTFAVAGDLQYLNEELLSMAIESLSGSLEDKVDPEIDYVICNDVHDESDNMKLAWEYGVPLLPETAFIRIFMETEDCDDDRFIELKESIEDMEANPIFDDSIDLAMKNGYSPLCFEIWQNGEWVDTAE